MSCRNPFLREATEPLGYRHANRGRFVPPRTTHLCQARDFLQHAGQELTVCHLSLKTKICNCDYVRPPNLPEAGVFGTDSKSFRSSLSSSTTAVPTAATAAFIRRRTFEYKGLLLLGNLHIVR